MKTLIELNKLKGRTFYSYILQKKRASGYLEKGTPHTPCLARILGYLNLNQNDRSDYENLIKL